MKLRRLAQELIDEFRAVREQGITARSRFDEALLGGPAPAVRSRDEVADPAAT
jgi:hypothetical protein